MLVQTETATIDGVAYKRHRFTDGTSIESPCGCFGHPKRCHTTVRCPWLNARKKRETNDE